MTDLYGVVGNPIAHSLSPIIHQQFAQSFDEQIEYRRFLVEPSQFNTFIYEFFETGGQGLNVTLPFKEQAYALCDRHTEIANAAKSVNTLWHDGKHLWGANTDGLGLVRDLKINLGCQIEGKNVLLLGAGGAVRGVLDHILSEKPKTIWLSNRTFNKAVQLQREFATILVLELGELETLDRVDLIINGTSASLAGDAVDLPRLAIHAETLCYDMMYSQKKTVFEQSVAEIGGRYQNGLGMLVEQAAESYSIWRKRRPQTADILARLRN